MELCCCCVLLLVGALNYENSIIAGRKITTLIQALDVCASPLPSPNPLPFSPFASASPLVLFVLLVLLVLLL